MRSIKQNVRLIVACTWLYVLAVTFADQYGCASDAECTVSSPTDDKVKGHCVNGRCACAPGYGGKNCSFGMSTIFHEHNIYTHFPADRPLDLVGWSAEKEVYHAVAEAVNAQLIVEVGTWKGLSASHIAGWLYQRGHGVLVCVDTWLGSVDFWMRSVGDGNRYLGEGNRYLHLVHGYPSVYYSFLANMVHLGLHDYVLPFPVPSRVAWEIFMKLNIQADMVHLDASQEYEDIKEDIRMWWQVVAPGGILMGDDYIDTWPGVIRAVKEFLDFTGLKLFALNESVNPHDNRVKWVVQKPRF